jgi:hypothetical protein
LVVTVIVAVPAEIAMTVPLALTTATALLLLVQDTPLMVALAGCTVAISEEEFPASSDSDVEDSVTPVTGTLLPEGGSVYFNTGLLPYPNPQK